MDPPSWISKFFQNVGKPSKITEKYSKSVKQCKKKKSLKEVKIVEFKLIFINGNTKITNLEKHVCQNDVAMVMVFTAVSSFRKIESTPTRPFIMSILEDSTAIEDYLNLIRFLGVVDVKMWEVPDFPSAGQQFLWWNETSMVVIKVPLTSSV